RTVEDQDSTAGPASILSDAQHVLPILRDIVELVGNRSYKPNLANIRLDKHIIPFMKLVAHKTFAKPSMEEMFQHIINTLYGPDGECAIKFFRGTLEHLGKVNSSSNVSFRDLVHLLCCVLNYVVRYNRRDI